MKLPAPKLTNGAQLQLKPYVALGRKPHADAIGIIIIPNNNNVYDISSDSFTPTSNFKLRPIKFLRDTCSTIWAVESAIRNLKSAVFTIGHSYH
jgi:hypothetical protein